MVKIEVITNSTDSTEELPKITNSDTTKVERTHWDGEEIGADVTCDILIKMFANLLQGKGYYKVSIINSMKEYIEEEDEVE